MKNQFETRLNDLQTDMVTICLEYCRDNCDEVYVHIIHENDSTFVNFFFRIDGQMRPKSRLTENGHIIDKTRQRAALDIILKNAQEILDILKNNNQPIPTEIRLIYSKKSSKLEVNYNYDRVKDETTTDRQISEKWFKSL